MGSEDDSIRETAPGQGAVFRTTLWTEVMLAGGTASPEAAVALDNLCRLYWYPLYAFIRRHGHDVHEAQDLTQAFFCKLIAQGALAGADREKGRFRSYLLARLKHFLANDWTYHRRQKRGGGQTIFSLDEVQAEGRYEAEPRCDDTPERLYERRWAQTLLDEVMRKLAEECAAAGQATRFEELKHYLAGAPETDSYAEVAGRLGMSASGIKSAVFRLRQRYRDLFRAEIGNTVATTAEIDEEIGYLFGVLRG